MRVSILLCAILVWGCSHKEAGEAGSCRHDGDNSCQEFVASMGAAGKRMCDPSKWTAGETSCPKENRLGLCRSRAGASWIYTGAPNNYTVESATKMCTHVGGDFTADHP
jgi:hypothetical protein